MPEKIEVPKSPCSMRQIHWKNCWNSGWSSPSERRMFSMSCALAESPAMITAGSPGDSRSNRNTITATTASTGMTAAIRLIRKYMGSLGLSWGQDLPRRPGLP